jgi:hypothetical protein
MDAVVVSYKNPWFFFRHLFGNRKGEKAKANSTFSPLLLFRSFYLFGGPDAGRGLPVPVGRC